MKTVTIGEVQESLRGLQRLLFLLSFVCEGIMKVMLCVWALMASVAQATTPVTAPAQPAVGVVVNIAWTAPTAHTDGTAISGPLTYTLYQGPKAGPFVKVGNFTGLSATIANPPPGACFELTAVEGASESLPTGPVCVTQPKPPGIDRVSVTVTIS